MALIDTITAHLAVLQQKRVDTKTSFDAEIARINEAIQQTQRALTLVQATPELEIILKFLNAQGLL
jgi:hypothetical protein